MKSSLGICNKSNYEELKLYDGNAPFMTEALYKCSWPGAIYKWVYASLQDSINYSGYVCDEEHLDEVKDVLGYGYYVCHGYGSEFQWETATINEILGYWGECTQEEGIRMKVKLVLPARMETGLPP